ncbi:hypothetical protein LTR37_011364 [Vermiconidia calcicola]|uniref:Uncharacterized protein n=1 Tax=Vermiconidia calcicola TaxID=1690605 RepID=A0ACC3N551_9PEZI|nr:hypothetical protein LTR37_011364 [Vermiconidia calcicola]
MEAMWQGIYKLHADYKVAESAFMAAKRMCTSYERALSNSILFLTETMRENMKCDEVVANKNTAHLSALRDHAEKHKRLSEREMQSAWEAYKAAHIRADKQQRVHDWKRRTEKDAKDYKPSDREHPNQHRQQNQPKGSSLPKPTATRQKPSRESIAEWFKALDVAFASYSSLRRFPNPPSWPCSRPRCSSDKSSRALDACECNIKHLFEGSRDLRAERLRWHPDKFSRAPVESREAFQKKAKEVFVVIDAMYKKETGI